MKITEFRPVDEREATRLIKQCEDRFTENVFRIADDIADHPMCRAVSLAGPSCAGKTSTAVRLESELEKCGRNVNIISIDDFFHDCDMDIRRPDGRPDYDTVRAIDLGYLEKCVADLMAGRPTLLPHFDFNLRRKDRYDEYLPGENDIYVFEGIQALYPEITSLFHGDELLRVFLTPDGEREVNGVRLGMRDARLIRRLVRDKRARATSIENNLTAWPDVVENEDLNIYPYVKDCEYKIDTFMDYEPFLMSRYLPPLVAEMPEGGVHRAEAVRLGELAEQFADTPVSSKLLPEDSVYFEFIEK